MMFKHRMHVMDIHGFMYYPDHVPKTGWQVDDRGLASFWIKREVIWPRRWVHLWGGWYYCVFAD